MPFDPRKLLAIPAAYKSLQNMLGGRRSAERLVYEIIRIRPGDRILDIGCGPAELLRYMPDVDYWGVDASEDYIAAAKATHGARGHFRVGEVRPDTSAQDFAAMGTFDKVLAIGLLHHLDDTQATALLRAAARILKPGGAVFTFDNVFIPDQNPIARTLIAMDRGQHVRKTEQYRTLAAAAFNNIELSIFHDLLRLPYTHIVMECR